MKEADARIKPNRLALATVATLLQATKMNGVAPLDRLSQTLTHSAQGWPASEIEALTPASFKPVSAKRLL